MKGSVHIRQEARIRELHVAACDAYASGIAPERGISKCQLATNHTNRKVQVFELAVFDSDVAVVHSEGRLLSRYPLRKATTRGATKFAVRDD